MIVSEEKLRRQLRVLGQRGSFDILYSIRVKPKYMKQISKEIGLPYTTVQKRIQDMLDADLLQKTRDVGILGKSIVRVKPTPFCIKLSMEKLIEHRNGETVNA